MGKSLSTWIFTYPNIWFDLIGKFREVVFLLYSGEPGGECRCMTAYNKIIGRNSVVLPLFFSYNYIGEQPVICNLIPTRQRQTQGKLSEGDDSSETQVISVGSGENKSAKTVLQSWSLVGSGSNLSNLPKVEPPRSHVNLCLVFVTCVAFCQLCLVFVTLHLLLKPHPQPLTHKYRCLSDCLGTEWRG